MSALVLGAGREKKEDSVNPYVGLLVFKKVGDYVKKGEIIGTILGDDESRTDASEERFRAAYTWSADPVSPVTPVYGYVDCDGFHPVK